MQYCYIMTIDKRSNIYPDTFIENDSRLPLYAPEKMGREESADRDSVKKARKQVEADLSMTDVASHFDAYSGASCEVEY